MLSSKKQLNPRNVLTLIISLFSIGILIPGLTLPILSVKLDASLKASVGTIESGIFDHSRSILGTISDLHSKDKILVAFLILFFSVLIPIIKSSLVLVCLFINNLNLRKKVATGIGYIAKWSMADVFVIAIFLSYLSSGNEATSNLEEVKILGMVLPIEIQTNMISSLGQGFWYFTGYCLLSIGATSIWDEENKIYE